MHNCNAYQTGLGLAVCEIEVFVWEMPHAGVVFEGGGGHSSSK